MKIEQGLFDYENLFGSQEANLKSTAQLVLYFGDRSLLKKPGIYDHFHKRYPNAIILGCTADGSIHGSQITEDKIVYSAIFFEKSKVSGICYDIVDATKSYDIGQMIATNFRAQKDLKGIFVLAEGLVINGSDLVTGINDTINDPNVVITGGLAGDGPHFEDTLVGYNADPMTKKIAAIGFYGESLNIGWGSQGGWRVFGPERVITKAQNNTMYELDGKPCLDLYKKYLGDKSNQLPVAALNFPLAIWPEKDPSKMAIIRTILSVNEAENSVSFAGCVPQGWKAQLMWGKFDDLVDGAQRASQNANIHDTPEAFSILVSCVGRKLLMGQRIVEEVIATDKELGYPQIGFYSYGEIAPQEHSKTSVFHNQSMTITTFSES